MNLFYDACTLQIQTPAWPRSANLHACGVTSILQMVMNLIKFALCSKYENCFFCMKGWKCGAHACIPPSICLLCWNLWCNFFAPKEVPSLTKNLHVAHLFRKLVGHVSICLDSHEFPCTNLTLSWFKQFNFALPPPPPSPKLSLEQPY